MHLLRRTAACKRGHQRWAVIEAAFLAATAMFSASAHSAIVRWEGSVPLVSDYDSTVPKGTVVGFFDYDTALDQIVKVQMAYDPTGAVNPPTSARIFNAEAARPFSTVANFVNAGDGPDFMGDFGLFFVNFEGLGAVGDTPYGLTLGTCITADCSFGQLTPDPVVAWSTGGFVSRLLEDPITVPTPPTALLLATGLALLGWSRRGRRA